MPTLFPYTTLFRSDQQIVVGRAAWGETDAAIADRHGGDAMRGGRAQAARPDRLAVIMGVDIDEARCDQRSEEHTSELQSRQYLVCRLLLEKKKIAQGKANDMRDTTPDSGTLYAQAISGTLKPAPTNGESHHTGHSSCATTDQALGEHDKQH